MGTRRSARPRGAPGHRTRPLCARPRHRRPRADHARPRLCAGRAGTRRRHDKHGAVRPRHPCVSPPTASHGRPGRVLGRLGGPVGSRALRRRSDHRVARLAVGCSPSLVVLVVAALLLGRILADLRQLVAAVPWRISAPRIRRPGGVVLVLNATAGGPAPAILVAAVRRSRCSSSRSVRSPRRARRRHAATSSDVLVRPGLRRVRGRRDLRAAPADGARRLRAWSSPVCP